MNAILTPDDDGDNEGTEVRAWHAAPDAWLLDLAHDDHASTAERDAAARELESRELNAWYGEAA